MNIQDLKLDDANRRPRGSGKAEGLRRQRSRSRALRALRPEVDDLAAALEAEHALALPGELSCHLLTYIALAAPELLAQLAAEVRANGPAVNIASNIGWSLRNTKATSWDSRVQAS